VDAGQRRFAASAPDRVETRVEDGVVLRAEIWDDLILPGVVPGPQAKTFRVYAIYDPDYKTPWLLRPPWRQPVFGIANRSAPRAASAACSWASHFRNFTPCQGKFAKRRP